MGTISLAWKRARSISRETCLTSFVYFGEHLYSGLVELESHIINKGQYMHALTCQQVLTGLQSVCRRIRMQRPGRC